MNIVADHVVELGAGKVILFSRKINFRELHLGARIGMIFHDVLPDVQRRVGFVQRSQRFRVAMSE